MELKSCTRLLSQFATVQKSTAFVEKQASHADAMTNCGTLLAVKQERGSLHMMRGTFHKFYLGLIVIAATLQLGCSKENLIPLTQLSVPIVGVKTKGVFCTEPPKVMGLYTKFLFVVDRSGSNSQTDPNYEFRYGNLRRFLDKYAENQFFSWGFIQFEGTTALSMIHKDVQDPDGNTVDSIFTEEKSEIESALETFRGLPHGAKTPYLAALNETKTGIANDLKVNPSQEAIYNIIFLSDGGPTDWQNDPRGFELDFLKSKLGPVVKSIIDLKPGSIHLSTVYYGDGDPDASSLMEYLASDKIGSGKYHDATQKGELNIDDLITVGSSSEPYFIRRLVVYNLNSANCDDGTVDTDSDADGLCDKDELSYNTMYAAQLTEKHLGLRFDSLRKNSFNENYSDLFILKELQGAVLPECPAAANRLDVDGDLLNECEELFLFNDKPDDRLKSLTLSKTTNPKDFDSDGDGILDGLEFLFFKSRSSAMSFMDLQARPYGMNGETNEWVFLNHLNPANPKTTKPYVGALELVSRTETGQFCYSYDQKELPLYETKRVGSLQAGGNLSYVHDSNENLILVYYIQTAESDPNGKGFLNFSIQRMTFGENTAQDIRLDNGLFTTVKPK